MVTQLGKGVKLQKAEKALAKADDLVDGEIVHYYAKCKNLSPMIDAVVVTNARIMGLQTLQGLKYRAPFSEVVAARYNQKKGTVEVTTTDGQVMTFKVHSDDVPTIQHHLEQGRHTPAPNDVTAALTALGEAASSVLGTTGASHEEYKAAKKTHEEESKSAKKARKEELEEQRAQEKAVEQAATAAKVGKLVASGNFGTKTVKIYQNGFIQIGLFASKAPYERLHSIEASADVGKKTGIGRVVVAVPTQGLNLLTSNKRGDVYLTIVTNRKTHVLHDEPPTTSKVKASKKLEAAGNAVIRSVATAPDAAANAESGPASSGRAERSVPDRLRELKAMQAEGLISMDEFQQQRAKLLDSL